MTGIVQNFLNKNKMGGHSPDIQKKMEASKKTYEAEIKRWIRYEKTFEFLKQAAKEWSEEEYAQTGKRHANVRLSSYSLDFTISVSKESHEVDRLSEYFDTLRRSLGKAWRRSVLKPKEGFLRYTFTNNGEDLEFDFDIHVSNGEKCKIEYETIPQPDRKVAKYDCGEFFNDFAKQLAGKQKEIGT